jgi:SAM-dependent methyltransferase
MKRHSNKRGDSQKFWNREYRQGEHLALSTEPSEDLIKFLRWNERGFGKKYLNPTTSVLDIGCGNGRNLNYLARTYGMHGVGYDISREAIIQAKKLDAGLNVTYEVRPLEKPLPLPDNSQTLVLDMMVSHVLKAEQRKHLLAEIVRVLKPGGWLFFKTFLLDEDLHAKRLLEEHPAEEPGSYVHPKIGVAEHVFTEQEISDLLSPYFNIHKMFPSHGHLRRAAKRRSISVWAQKKA